MAVIASIDISGLAAGATLLLTATLVGLTWHYVRSTASMAKSSADSARWAHEAARSALLQGALLVQPRLMQAKPLKVESASGSSLGLAERAVKVPIDISTEIGNDGPGPALNVEASLTMWGIALRPARRLDGISLSAGDVLDLSFRLPHSSRLELATAIRQDPGAESPGLLEIVCEDSLGLKIITRWTVAKRQREGTFLANRKTEYLPISEDARDLPIFPLPR